jgi:hypothetical protein
MDVDAIPLGVNFVKVLGEQVAKCGVLLAVMGAGWLDARDEDGHRRLDNPHDFIRIEIAAALKRDIPVIPILLEGTRAPRVDQLPDDLRDLAVRNGLAVRHASFHSDMERLIRELNAGVPVEYQTPRSKPEIALAEIDRAMAAGVRLNAPARLRCGLAGLILTWR